MSEETFTVRVPLALRKRGGRKVVVAPDEAEAVPGRSSANWTRVKNIARAFRWQRMLESGAYATIAELAQMEQLTGSYVGRLLKLTLLPAANVEMTVKAAQNQMPVRSGPVLMAPAE